MKYNYILFYYLSHWRIGKLLTPTKDKDIAKIKKLKIIFCEEGDTKKFDNPYDFDYFFRYINTEKHMLYPTLEEVISDNFIKLL